MSTVPSALCEQLRVVSLARGAGVLVPGVVGKAVRRQSDVPGHLVDGAGEVSEHLRRLHDKNLLRFDGGYACVFLFFEGGGGGMKFPYVNKIMKVHLTAWHTALVKGMALWSTTDLPTYAASSVSTLP